MGRFAVRPVRFGRKPEAGADEDAEGLPAPHRLKLAARRTASIAAAREVLEQLPAAGESLHVVCSKKMDLADAIAAVLETLGRCDTMRIATLGYNVRNLKTMLTWLDTGAVDNLSLVASLFFRSHNGELWERTQEEFRQRKQRAACCDNHAKVVSMQFGTGERLSVEGSANLCGNGSGREQFALIHDADLHDWHSGWIEALLNKHEGEGDE